MLSRNLTGYRDLLALKLTEKFLDSNEISRRVLYTILFSIIHVTLKLLYFQNFENEGEYFKIFTSNSIMHTSACFYVEHPWWSNGYCSENLIPKNTWSLRTIQ